MDGGGGFAVELLVDDALDESFKGRLGAGEAEGKGSGAGDELAEFRVGEGEFFAGECVVVAGWAWSGDGSGHKETVSQGECGCLAGELCLRFAAVV